MSTFTAKQQTMHRETFIRECYQKAWGAACHADWIAKQLDEGIGRFQKMQEDDRRMETEIKELEAAVDAHMRDNREKRKAIQELRNTLAKAIQSLGQNVQQGQQALTGLYQSIESNIALAKHAERYEWKEADSAATAEEEIVKTHGTDKYRFMRDWADHKAGEIVAGVEIGDGVIFNDLIAGATIEKVE